jgi:polar amino acid transport system permease protein
VDINAWIALLNGAWTTLWVSALSMLLGVPAGLAVAMLRGARIPVLGPVLSLYISVVRAIPMVTLVLFLFVAGSAFELDFDIRVVAVAALTINTTAFNAEIWRSAFANFPREQIEAARAAGMTKWLMLRRIQLPQMLITSLPNLVNEMSLLIKSSPAIAMVGLVDLTRVTIRIGAVTFDPLPPILAAWGIYVLMIGGLVRLQRAADRYARRLAM